LRISFFVLMALALQVSALPAMRVDLGSTLVANVVASNTIALPTHRTDIGQPDALRLYGPSAFVAALLEGRYAIESAPRDRKPTVCRARSYPVRVRSRSADDIPST
jgi:hypothetical protein